jgi:integrase
MRLLALKPVVKPVVTRKPKTGIATMPALTNRPPKLCKHKGTGQAVVYIQGKARYLGKFGSSQARAAYEQVKAEWAARLLATPAAPVSQADVVSVVAPRRLSIAEAVVQFRAHARRYYGTSREFDNLREAIGPLREDFGYMPMSDFGPLQLRVLRNKWIGAELARNTINARIIRIKRFFRWAVSHELVDVSVLARLNSMESLMPGRGGRETTPKEPITWEAVETTLPYLPEMVQAMVLFGWHAGPRPSELTSLTTAMVDQTGEVWIARLVNHKTALHGHKREILINRPAQAVLAPWLRPDEPDEPIFSPRRVDERQGKRLDGKRPPGRAYSRAAFQQVVRRACRRAGIPGWTPNQLRHAYGTRLRDVAGIEAAQMALGHAKPDTSLIYTSAARGRAIEAVKALG